MKIMSKSHLSGSEIDIVHNEARVLKMLLGKPNCVQIQNVSSS